VSFLLLFITHFFTPFICAQFVVVDKFFNECVFIDALATLRYIDENEKIEYDMPETQEILSVRLAQLRILDALEETLYSLVFHEVLSDDLFL